VKELVLTALVGDLVAAVEAALPTGIPWSGLGWGALIFLAVILIMRGDLVSKKVYEQKVREADKWEEAFRLEREGRFEAMLQNEKLLRVADVMEHFLEEIKPVVSRGDDGG
jgi:hypothetical protein